MHRFTCALVALVIVGSPSPTTAGSESPDIATVVLADVGGGFAPTDDAPGQTGSFTRNFTNGARSLTITGFAVTTPPGPRVMFDALTTTEVGIDTVPEPEFELGVWLVPPGGAPGDFGFSALVVASAGHLFAITLNQPADDGFDGPSFVREVAGRQVAIAGGEGRLDQAVRTRSVDDADLLPFLPESPPAGYGLGPVPMTVAGADDLEVDEFSAPEAVAFLNDRAKNVARVWVGSDLSLGVGITQYPYEIFAAAALGASNSVDRSEAAVELESVLPNAVSFNDPVGQQVAVVFRRGDVVVTVLADYFQPSAAQHALDLANETAALISDRLPRGDTSPYTFPDPPARFVGLFLTAMFVTAAFGGSTAVARVRARRVRRGWTEGATPTAGWSAPGSMAGHVVELDDDAAALRRRGRVVAVVQIVTVNIGVVALAGDFAWVGVGVAAVALLSGLGFSRWWLRHEHELLGPAAAPPAFLVPRFWGAVTGVAAMSVLGVGVAYLLKGVRYIILSPTIAQLRWSDLFGFSPRTVGVVFAIGGLVTTGIGAILYRIARSLARAGVAQVLAADPRSPILYLRSFGDDSVPLPTIASARRPLFELFSLRGADPFEEAVAWELDSYGPVVAVGRPGGSLRSLGAAREHLSNETWHGEIADRMVDAGLIALAPGETEGLTWELNAIVEGRHLAKTLFVFPPLAPAALDRRWEHTLELLRAAGASVDALPVGTAVTHTVRIEESGALRVTTARTRDEATYRTAVDRAMEQSPAPVIEGSVA
ncbi:MAG: hypothetical protein ABIP17_15525 [Ilumatobacteraceae bacterium]